MAEITREEMDAKIETKFVTLLGKIDLLAEQTRIGFQHQAEMIALLRADINETKAFVKNSQITIIATIMATVIGSMFAVIAIIVK